MAGLQHEFVAGVEAATDVKYAVTTGTGPRSDRLHCTQAFLDGACGLMCVVQAAMLLTGRPRASFERLPSTRNGPLSRLWTVAHDRYFEGTDENDVALMVKAFGPELECEQLVTTSISRIGTAVAKAVRGGHVPIVRFESRVWAHWTTVIGVETVAGTSTPHALLTLDPSASPPWCAFYNGRMELTAATAGVRCDRTFNRPYRFTTGEAWAVRLQGLVVIKRGQPP